MYDESKPKINPSALSWTLGGFIIVYLVGTSLILDIAQQRGYLVAYYMDRILVVVGVFMAGGIFRTKSAFVPTLWELFTLWVGFVMIGMLKIILVAYYHTPTLLTGQMLLLHVVKQGILMAILTFFSLYIGGILFSRSRDEEEEFWDEDDRRAWL